MPTEATMTPYGFTTRARSASPPLFSPSAANVNDQVPTYAFPSPATKKRSAVAAFNVDPGPAEVYEHMRLPARKAQLHIQPSNGADSSNGSGLGRSSSLSRQIARMPSSLSSSRRGSVGNHHYTHTPSASDDLRHAAMLSKWHSEEYAHYNHQQLPHPPQSQVPLVTSVPHPSFPYNDYSALVAPYQGQAQPQMVPPEVSSVTEIEGGIIDCSCSTWYSTPWRQKHIPVRTASRERLFCDIKTQSIPPLGNIKCPISSRRRLQLTPLARVYTCTTSSSPLLAPSLLPDRLFNNNSRISWDTLSPQPPVMATRLRPDTLTSRCCQRWHIRPRWTQPTD
jgi:hypothetical protein